MPLRLEIKRQLSGSSERVKCTDIHPTEPWILSALYSGHVFIWNYQTQTVVKTFEVCDLPVRCAKFIPKKQWIVCGADDMHIRVYNYNTMERIHTFEAHTDYIRSLAVHPTLPLVLSSSDDMYIKLWDWEKNWDCVQVFEGHSHYVMQVEFNPKDTNTFASASLDRSVKVWGLNSPQPHFSLEGHERGVNCVSYFRGGDMPYLISGADDSLVKIWDYQTKSCVATLDGHTNNVSAVSFHPHLPIIVSGSEDGTVRIWHSTTYRLENTLNYGMGRVWSISSLFGTNKVALGYDDGTIMIKLGHEEPVVSMERNGKIVWARNHEILLANAKRKNLEATDGEVLALPSKELGRCEIYPQSVQHSPNGRLLTVCGDGEYIIYTALSLKNKSFGQALEFVWAADSGVYATRDSSTRVRVFKNFKEHQQFRPPFAAEGIFGGQLLAVRSSDCVDFYDWDECRIIRRIDVCPRKVYWSEGGEVVVLACEAQFYVLRYNRELVQKFLDQGIEVAEQGIENSFDLEQEVAETVSTGYFVGDCFIYTNSAGRLNYYVGGEVITLAHLDKAMYLLGYIPKSNRVYLMDKAHNVYSYELLISVLVYQTAIVRRDLDAAEKALLDVPKEHRNRLAHFLEAQDLKELALEVTDDPEHKFELAIALRKMDIARDVLMVSESDLKWKQLGDVALAENFDVKMAEECFSRAKDMGGLLLLHSSKGDRKGMARLAQMAREKGQNNIAFIASFMLNDINACIKLLCDTGRIPEAAFMARTYAPSQISDILKLWKEDLKGVSARAAEALADPHDVQELFENLPWGVKVEKFLQQQQAALAARSARSYLECKDDVRRNLVEEMKSGSISLAVEKKQPTQAAPIDPTPVQQRDPTPEPEPTKEPEPEPEPELTPAAAVVPADPEPEPEPEPAPVVAAQPDLDLGGFDDAAPAAAAAQEEDEDPFGSSVAVDEPTTPVRDTQPVADAIVSSSASAAPADPARSSGIDMNDSLGVGLVDDDLGALDLDTGGPTLEELNKSLEELEDDDAWGNF